MKRVLCLLIVALTGISAGAQTSIGNRVGIGWFNHVLKGDEDVEDFWTEDQTHLVAPTITLPVEIRISNRVALQPELGFVQRGSRNVADYGTSTFQVNSVELSLLAKGFLQRGKWKAYLFAGPSISRAISVRSYFDPSSGPSQDAVGTADDYPLEILQLSGTAGLGVAARIGIPWLFLDYRRLWGLTPLMELDFTDVNGNVLKDGRLYDRGTILSIGIMIPLSRGAWAGTATEPGAPADPQN